MKGKVAIIGTGMAKCGKSPVPSSLLFAEASLEAIKEASLTISEIQGLHVGNAYSATTESQTNIAPVILSALGVKNNIPCARYEAACCSGSIAFRQGYLNILSGEYDYLLVGGTERLRAVSGTEIRRAEGRSDIRILLGLCCQSLCSEIWDQDGPDGAASGRNLSEKSL
jgi:acetyl-CoA C-acetyltransferase